MSVTRLKRKHRKNIARANNKQHIIKELLRTPVLKNVDLEELKSRFTTTGAVAGAVAAVKETATAVAEKVEQTATAAVEKVEKVADDAAHSSVVEKAKAAVGDVVEKAQAVAASVAHSSFIEQAQEAIGDAIDKVKEVADNVAHSDLVENAKEAVGDVVEKVKEAVSGTDETAANAAAFDDAEAVTKPVNEDGQEGEHPKPEIAL